MKRYVDADKIIQATIEVSEDLWQFEKLMKEKPNFNKSKINDEKYNKKIDKKIKRKE